MSFQPGQGYRSDDTPSVPLGDLVDLMGERNDEIDRLLGADGPLAQAMGPAFKPRSAQVRFSQDTFRAFKTGRHLLAELGTGTGKSLGYLVPAILWAVEHREAVVVATATKSLQDQLQNKDLPFLQQHLGVPFQWCVLKGRANYLCEAKGGEVDLEFQTEMNTIMDWLEDTSTGDLGELPFDVTQDHYYRLRQQLIADPEDCPGEQKCEWGRSGDCWFYRARARARQSHIIVVNHALLAIDIMLGGQLLPPHKKVILDEAHQFEEWVRDMTEASLSAARVKRLCRKIQKTYPEVELEQLGRAGDEFFLLADQHVRRLIPRTGATALPRCDLPTDLLKAADELAERLQVTKIELATIAACEDSGKAEVLSSATGELQNHVRAIREPNPAFVLWAEVKHQDNPAKLKLTMVDVAPYLREHLFRERTCVLASATLATGEGEEGFRYIREALGIDQCRVLQKDSPFDWRRQALYYLPQLPADLHERRQGEDWKTQAARTARELAPHIRQVLHITRGRAFVLFTSYEVLNQVADLLHDLPFPMVRQGHMSKQATIEWFKETPNPVLFATSSFWEGVDVPGEQLSCVIIDKIPFPNASDDPVWAAREERVGKREAFVKLSLPVATTALKQGVGRLIRSESDHGLLVLLDPRFRSKRYGAGILRALPGAPVVDRYPMVAQADLPRVEAFLAPRRAASSPAEQWAHQALITLAGLDPDQASTRNGVGFNQADSRIGHALATLLAAGQHLTDKQWAAGVELCRKYHRQIGACPDGQALEVA